MPASRPSPKRSKPQASVFRPLQWIKRALTGRWRSSSSDTPSRGEALRSAHGALQAMLAKHSASRRVLSYLHHLEVALGRDGSRALMTLPEKVLRGAIEQLDLLEGEKRSQKLMPLRLRIREALQRRNPALLRGDIAKVEVSDVSHSVFQELESQWTGRAHLDKMPRPHPARAAK